MRDNQIYEMRFRNNFYPDNYRRIVTALWAMVIVNVALLLMIAWLVMHPKKPDFYATLNNGTIVSLTPEQQVR